MKFTVVIINIIRINYIISIFSQQYFVQVSVKLHENEIW